MMKKHELIYGKIKVLLNKHFPDQIEENEKGMYVSIKDTGLWISSDPRELTVGYGMTHIHCDPEYDDLNEAIELFFNLMTCKKQITQYYKGGFAYKHRIDLLVTDNKVYNLGTAKTWLYPYWKKTTIKVEIKDEIIELNKVHNDLNEIKTMHNTC
jgi:hypothetical protein